MPFLVLIFYFFLYFTLYILILSFLVLKSINVFYFDPFH